MDVQTSYIQNMAVTVANNVHVRMKLANWMNLSQTLSKPETLYNLYQLIVSMIRKIKHDFKYKCMQCVFLQMRPLVCSSGQGELPTISTK